MPYIETDLAAADVSLRHLMNRFCSSLTSNVTRPNKGFSSTYSAPKSDLSPSCIIGDNKHISIVYAADNVWFGLILDANVRQTFIS